MARRRPRRSSPQGLEAAKPFIEALVEAQQQIAQQAAKPTAEFPLFPDYQDDAYAAVAGTATEDTTAALTIADKQERENRLDEIKERGQGRSSASSSTAARRSCRPRSASLHEEARPPAHPARQVRIDGRGLADIRHARRPRSRCCPRVHGSALFERGETQILGVTTLNMLRMEQQLDTLAPGDAQALHAQLQLPAVLHR